jgi:hypothetical protein
LAIGFSPWVHQPFKIRYDPKVCSRAPDPPAIMTGIGWSLVQTGAFDGLKFLAFLGTPAVFASLLEICDTSLPGCRHWKPLTAAVVEVASHRLAIPFVLQMTLLTWDPNDVRPESHHTVALPMAHAWIKQTIAVLLAQ